MHEMSLCEGVLQVIEDNARQQNYEKVSAVWLEIGALAGVEVEAMRFCFDAVTRGSIADGARLEILGTPGTAWCMGCMKSVTVSARYDLCPSCGGAQLHVTGGDEMRIKELEVV